MKDLSSRLKQLEAERTPVQVVKAYLLKQQAFDSLDQLMDWSFTDEALTEITRNRESMFESATKGGTAKERPKIIRKTARQVEFLFQLAMAPASYWEHQKYRVLYCQSTACHLLTRRTWQGKDWTADKVQLDAQQFKHTVEEALTAILSLQNAAKIISKCYFDGLPLLLPSQLKQDERLLTHLEGMAAFYLDDLWLYTNSLADEPEPQPFDMTTIQDAVNAELGPQLAELMISEAKMTVYSSEGNHALANQVYNRAFSS